MSKEPVIDESTKPNKETKMSNRNLSGSLYAFSSYLTNRFLRDSEPLTIYHEGRKIEIETSEIEDNGDLFLHYGDSNIYSGVRITDDGLEWVDLEILGEATRKYIVDAYESFLDYIKYREDRNDRMDRRSRYRHGHWSRGYGDDPIPTAAEVSEVAWNKLSTRVSDLINEALHHDQYSTTITLPTPSSTRLIEHLTDTGFTVTSDDRVDEGTTTVTLGWI